MKLFGFELTTYVYVLSVICPKCGKNATIMFRPSKENRPLPRLIIEDGKITKVEPDPENTYPDCEDLHLLCWGCARVIKYCKIKEIECRIEGKPKVET